MKVSTKDCINICELFNDMSFSLGPTQSEVIHESDTTLKRWMMLNNDHSTIAPAFELLGQPRQLLAVQRTSVLTWHSGIEHNN